MSKRKNTGNDLEAQRRIVVTHKYVTKSGLRFSPGLYVVLPDIELELFSAGVAHFEGDEPAVKHPTRAEILAAMRARTQKKESDAAKIDLDKKQKRFRDLEARRKGRKQ